MDLNRTVRRMATIDKQVNHLRTAYSQLKDYLYFDIEIDGSDTKMINLTNTINDQITKLSWEYRQHNAELNILTLREWETANGETIQWLYNRYHNHKGVEL